MTRRFVTADPRPARHRVRSTQKLVSTAVLCLLSLLSGSPGVAQDATREQMKGLDEQVQEIKTDVLSIAAELNGLEERLLYPSNTQLAIFVALAENQEFRLDSVQIQLDGTPVAHHIYSFKELEALQRGGVQRIYTGNIPTGHHELEVEVAGKLVSGKDFSNTESFTINKDVEPRLVGITLAEPGLMNPGIALGDW